MVERTAGPRPHGGSRIRALRRLVDTGAARYDPARHFDRLFTGAPPGTPGAGDAAHLARLKRALRVERRKARAGHWSYDLNRHIGLLQALKAALEERKAAAQPACGAACNGVASSAVAAARSVKSAAGTKAS